MAKVKKEKSADEQLLDRYVEQLLKDPKQQTVTVSRDHYMWIAQTIAALHNRIDRTEAERRQAEIDAKQKEGKK